MRLWLVTYGSGHDGDEWGVLGIFTSSERAEEFRKSYPYSTQVEEWDADPPVLFDGIRVDANLVDLHVAKKEVCS
jgi:hypothetical protein